MISLKYSANLLNTVMNNIGPKTDLWGTPTNVCAQLFKVKPSPCHRHVPNVCNIHFNYAINFKNVFIFTVLKRSVTFLGLIQSEIRKNRAKNLPQWSPE